MKPLSTSMIFDNPADMDAFLTMFGFVHNGTDSEGNRSFKSGVSAWQYATVFNDFTGKRDGQSNLVISDFSKTGN